MNLYHQSDPAEKFGPRIYLLGEWFISSELAGGVWIKVKDGHGFLKGSALRPLCHLVRGAGPCFELENELPVYSAVGKRDENQHRDGDF